MALFKHVAAPVFAILAVGQAIRFFQQWPVTVNDISVPLWPSAIAAIAFATLAIGVWREGGRSRR